VVRLARPSRSRKWRRRGRRGQVAAVATLLGLLLVVTFIANFLTTVVPNQMQVNDFNHALAVEDQFGRLAALLASAGADGSSGIQVVQPISLGSDGVPPWTPPDGASLGGGRPGSNLSLSYGLAGELVYGPPLGYPQGGPPLPAGCSWTSVAHVGISCGGGAGVVAYNFSGDGKNFSVGAVGGVTLYAFNFSTNNSHITVSATGGASSDITIFGSNDVVTFSLKGGATMNVTVIGSHDLLNLGNTGGGTVIVRVYGSYDSVYQSATGGATVTVIIFGQQDTFVGNSTGGGTYHGYVTGFNATNPVSPLCPYDNLSSSDTLGGSHVGGGTVNATYNTTNFNGNTTLNGWTIHYQTVGPANCPFFARADIGVSNPSLSGGGIAIHLTNTYSPSGEIAYDEGAVIYAQYGGYPVMIDGPSVALTRVGGLVTAVSLWFPSFTGAIGSVAGIGTETLNLRLLRSQTLTVLAGAPNLGIDPGSPILITVHTPYAEAWVHYLSANLGFAGLWSCTPAATCTGAYAPGGSLGTVSITIPTTSVSELVAGTSVFSVALS
jgi:hypothetical protein